MYDKKYKILMLATSMLYGGAETHILELARYLSINGCEVRVMSNAGGDDLFVQELGRAGIEHIYAPFDSRGIFAMGRSGKILKQALRAFKPDIVHAHSRIPAFIAARVCRRLRTPLVTTMHGTYKNTPLLRLLTNWGDYSLYVSGDIKDYWTAELARSYKIRPGHMTHTVNGINTGLFAPPAGEGGCGADIRAEFGIGPDEKIILTVCRLENRGGFDLSYSAAKLCEIAGDIYAQDKNTRIIIVGGGEFFPQIKNRADAVNSRAGFEHIIMAGSRADVYKFCAACSVYVGVSRSAMEAAACAKPVILCGATDWLGRFTRENARDCEATNFTCRGFGHPENLNQALLGEILFCLANDTRADCEYGADLIKDKYSVKKMADDAYSVYRKAELRYKDYDFVLTGYYGSNNIGDDALLFSILSNILKLQANLKICVLTKNTRKIQGWLDSYFANIVTKHRFNMFSVRSAIKKSRALVFGGGTLLQDLTSSRSLFYYLSLIEIARKNNKKAILYANGIGPLYAKKNQERVRQIIGHISLATIRDEESYNYLINLGMDRSKVYFTADEAMTIKDYHGETGDFREYIKSKYVVVSVRKWQGLGSDFFGEFAAAVNNICREYGLTPVYIVMKPEEDKAVSQKLADMHGQAYVFNTGGDIGKVLAVVKSAEAVISMRLHALIFAGAFGVPMLGVCYDPKVRGFLELIYGDNKYAVELADFSAGLVAEKFALLYDKREAVAHEIAGRAQGLYEQAAQNARLFLEEMEK